MMSGPGTYQLGAGPVTRYFVPDPGRSPHPFFDPRLNFEPGRETPVFRRYSTDLSHHFIALVMIRPIKVVRVWSRVVKAVLSLSAFHILNNSNQLRKSGQGGQGGQGGI